ncbi:unnamed protein product [Nippostrongylus brasiliensis]|uniref:Secreted protein n=1 Tax=Nippostrongylus brasiliensis TaxID=27835 RepID=A0A0N4XKY0_NIPBR|nr:unnamed protein product [Nippostrongylus brasiliensis]
MPCSLFVPTVKGSRQCAVCHCSLDDHRITAIYVEPSAIFSTPNTPSTARRENRKIIIGKFATCNAFLTVEQRMCHIR